MGKSIAVLGSTGSIGTQALEVIAALGWRVSALTARRSAALLEEQARRFRPKMAALADEAAARALKQSLRDTDIRVLAGESGVAECAAAQCDIALNGIVGVAGLRPSVAALEAGHALALANKESLVAGGAFITRLAREKNLPILPVDSEHSAVFQCLQGLRSKTELRRVILTASGGAFYGKSREALRHATAADALRHPNWSMGAKITVDSATMFNKGLEIMEAAWLFGLPAERVDVWIHRQSVVHSLIECADGAVLAQFGAPDMRLPIQYALTWPERRACPGKRLNLADWGTLTFEPPDDATFPAMRLCREAYQMGGLAGAVLNGANEAANALFRAGKIGFLEIAALVEAALRGVPHGSAESLDDVFQADQYARERVHALQKGTV
ncbi:MAG: 1-deoxy-D-xylulose-5-phosphate reductoisomerase [Oscillospiraceae bacterium]|jgi:1-deoxy-D-xylulose-5-phosphate reductoisomerase|nr:1-deoxy-D-xylulose-5-phosphate reductoisomerase [Oscillospiraceae bacterium]